MKLSFSVSKIVIWSLVGFVFCSMVLLYPYIIKQGSPFHKIKIDYQKSWKSLLEKRLDALTKLQTIIGDSITKIPCIQNKASVNTSCAELFLKQKEIAAAIRNTRKDIIKNSSVNTDTISNYFLNYLSFNRSDLFDSLTSNKLGSLHIDMYDSASLLEPEAITITIQPEVKTPSSSFSFFNKYPSIAFWFVLSIIQSTLWFMIIGFFSTTRFQDADIRRSLRNKVIEFFKKFSLPFFAVSLFAAILYWVMIDRHSISDHYFLDHFNKRMIFYAIPGYMAAVICFGVYLNLTKQLEVEDRKIQTDGTLLNTDFESLEKKFRMAFFLSVIILSLFVLWVGLLVSGINSMDAMKIYSFVTKEPFMQYDFVYLIGLLHSLLLAVFYIPAQLKFSSLRSSQDPNEKVQNKWWNNIAKNIFTILVPATPLLTGLIQGLIDSFLK